MGPCLATQQCQGNSLKYHYPTTLAHTNSLPSQEPSYEGSEKESLTTYFYDESLSLDKFAVHVACWILALAYKWPERKQLNALLELILAKTPVRTCFWHRHPLTKVKRVFSFG